MTHPYLIKNTFWVAVLQVISSFFLSMYSFTVQKIAGDSYFLLCLPFYWLADMVTSAFTIKSDLVVLYYILWKKTKTKTKTSEQNLTLTQNWISKIFETAAMVYKCSILLVISSGVKILLEEQVEASSSFFFRLCFSNLMRK